MAGDQADRIRRVGTFRVGEWLVEPSLCQLTRGETSQRIRPQLMDLLVCLATDAGQVVLKDEILAAVWPGQYIAESGLSRCVAELRQSLQDDAHEPRYIETIPKRGYRLIAPVTHVTTRTEPEDAPAGPAAAHPESPPGPGDAHAQLEEGARQDQPPARARPKGWARRRWPIPVAGLVVVLVVGLSFLWRAGRAPALTERDLVVLAFENRTGDRVFDGALRLALAVQLEQSPYLRILPEERVRRTLQLMGQSPDTAVSRTVAAEICERESATAMLVGSIAPLGTHYALGLEAVACRTGESLVRRQVEVPRVEEVLDTLGRMASEMRQRLGESLGSVARFDVPIAQATTSSLEALRAFSLAEDERWGEDPGGRRAMAFYRRAIELDPSFALAYVRLAGLLRFHFGRVEAVESYRKAFELRDRVSQPERYDILSQYYAQVTGERDRALEVYTLWKEAYPRSWTPWYNLAIEHLNEGRYLEAADGCRTALELAPHPAGPAICLARALMALGRYDEAASTLERARERGADAPGLHETLAMVGFARGDAAAVDREIRWAERSPETERTMLRFRAWTSMRDGRRREALSCLERAMVLSQAGPPEQVAQLHADSAFVEMTAGNPRLVVDAARAATAASSSIEIRGLVAIPLAVVGQSALAGELLAGITPAPDVLFQQIVMGSSRAAIALSAGQPTAALRELDAIKRFESGIHAQLIPLWLRGEAYLAAGDARQAAETFQRVLDLRGVSPVSMHLALAERGLARARAASGDVAGALRAYETLLENWAHADPDLPVLAIIRREREALASTGRPPAPAPRPPSP